MNAKFYIITRFNTPCFAGSPHLMRNCLNPVWLRARLYLLRRFCAPSIRNQSWQGFEWLLWCHPYCPDWLVDELEGIEGATLVFEKCVRDVVTEPECIVTTRVDSDDMIHRDYMKAIGAHLPAFIETGHTRQVYSFRKGYRYMTRAGPRGTIQQVFNPAAPFLTLFADIRETDKDCIVYCTGHDSIVRKFPTKYDNELSAWMWLQHDDNIAGTGFRIGGLVGHQILSEFGAKALRSEAPNG